jgi:hypothetical protein
MDGWMEGGREREIVRERELMWHDKRLSMSELKNKKLWQKKITRDVLQARTKIHGKKHFGGKNNKGLWHDKRLSMPEFETPFLPQLFFWQKNLVG